MNMIQDISDQNLPRNRGSEVSITPPFQESCVQESLRCPAWPMEFPGPDHIKILLHNFGGCLHFTFTAKQTIMSLTLSLTMDSFSH